MRLLAGVAFLMGVTTSALAQQDAGSPWIETRYHRVHLRNGNTIDGHLINDSRTALVLKLKVGEMQIRRDMIDRVELVRMRSLKEVPEFKPAKSEIAAAVKPAPTDSTEPGQKPIAPAPSDLAAGVPHETRTQMDGVIHAWIAAGQRGDLSQQLEPLSAEGMRYLCALLDEKPRRVPAAPLCAVLARRGDAFSIPSIARVLIGSPLDDREAASAALADMGLLEAAPYLLQTLEDPSNTVWRAASRGVIALHKKFPQERLVDAVIAGMEKAKIKLPHALTLGAMEGDDSYRALTYLLRGDERDQIAGLQGISRRLAPQDGQLVMPMLFSSSRMVRQQACGVLGKSKYKAAVSDLIEMMREEDVGIVGDAHRALQEITGQSLARSYDLWRSWWEAGGKDQFPK